MRPAILNPLFAAVTSLPGVGPKQDKLFRFLLGRDDTPRLVDLLLHLPGGFIDRRNRPKIRDAAPGTIVTLSVTIDRHRAPPPGRARAPYLVYAHDKTGDVVLTWFHGRKDYLDRLLPVGEVRHVSGRVEMFDGTLQMVHPDRVVDDAGLATMPAVDPVYPLTQGLAIGVMRRAAQQALERLPHLGEWIPAEVTRAFAWPSFHDALTHLHRPGTPDDMLPENRFWTRLAYDELLAGQIALALVRAQLRRPAGQRHAGDGHLREAVRAALPFTLTNSQAKAEADIVNDLAQPLRMLRLVQGDVGSGKTVVALLAAAAVIETGKQAALMAPTEILARQHFATIAPLAEKAGIRVAILTGREKGKARDDLLARLAGGDIDLIVGTHAIIQDDVAFKALALAIVDEQHRFGVRERLAPTQKGAAVDMLVLTATPIPRTLVLTYFGDMDISELREKPKGRKPIDTRLVPAARLADVVDAVGRAIDDGRRVFWVVPLVSESDEIDLTNAEHRFAELQKRFGARVGLVHGRMRGPDKDRAMAAFASGETQILVATTVIEVGVDVPAATIMVIEHAERFGLSQLHQLRGRIGRGSEQSTCLMLYAEPLGDIARERLKVMRDSEDGFVIAEKDLQLRGEGDVLGVRQSGLPGYRIARPDVHRDLLARARQDAADIVRADPKLMGESAEAVRCLLYLFERDAALPLMSAG